MVVMQDPRARSMTRSKDPSDFIGLLKPERLAGQSTYFVSMALLLPTNEEREFGAVGSSESSS